MTPEDAIERLEHIIALLQANRVRIENLDFKLSTEELVREIDDFLETSEQG